MVHSNFPLDSLRLNTFLIFHTRLSIFVFLHLKFDCEKIFFIYTSTFTSMMRFVWLTFIWAMDAVLCNLAPSKIAVYNQGSEVLR